MTQSAAPFTAGPRVPTWPNRTGGKRQLITVSIAARPPGEGTPRPAMPATANRKNRLGRARTGLVQIAIGYGVAAESVSTTASLIAALNKALGSNRPSLTEINTQFEG